MQPYLIIEQNVKKLKNSGSVVNGINMMAAAAVNCVYFLETWLKFPNNLLMTKQRRLSFKSGRIEVDELNSFIDVMTWIKQKTRKFENYGL